MSATHDLDRLAELKVRDEEEVQIVAQAVYATKSTTPHITSSNDWLTIASILAEEVERLSAIEQHQLNILHRAGLTAEQPSTPRWGVGEIGVENLSNKSGPQPRKDLIDKLAQIVYAQNPAVQPWDGDAYTYAEAVDSHQGKTARVAAEQIALHLLQGVVEKEPA